MCWWVQVSTGISVWRCEAWHEPLGPLLEFDRLADQRDRCTACTMSCYRDTSVLMQACVAAGEAASHLRHGAPLKALSALFSKSVAVSLGAILEEVQVWGPLAGLRMSRHANTGTGSSAGRNESKL